MASCNKTLMASLLALVVIPMAFAQAEDRLRDPAMGSSSGPGEHEAQSESISDHMADSESISDHMEQSEDIHDHSAGSENSDDMLSGASSPGTHAGRSSELQALPDAGVADAEVKRQDLEEVEARDDAASSSPLDSEIESIHAVKSQLAEARARADLAERAYGVMRQRDYPRGEAARKIIDERQVSKRKVDELEARYNQLLGAASPQ